MVDLQPQDPPRAPSDPPPHRSHLPAADAPPSDGAEHDATIKAADPPGKRPSLVRRLTGSSQAAQLVPAPAAAEAASNAPEEDKSTLDREPARKEQTFAEQIAPLAKRIAEYILDHQDDSAQEERWRTMMKRDMAKASRDQREQVQKVEEKVEAQIHELHEVHRKVEGQVQKVEGQINEVHRKLDQVLKHLVKAEARGSDP